MSNLKKAKGRRRAILYTRVSTEEQAVKGYSLIDQEETLRRACEKDGAEIIEHFQDDGYSAKTFKRPAFQRMLTLLKTKKLQADYLYVVRYDRFSRNARNTYIMCAELESYGIMLRCLEDLSDDSEPIAPLYSALKIAEPEVDKTSYREELPLRGFLQCPKCQTTWTGSGSKGNGGVYHYYHCQNGCKERVKAEEINLAFVDYLRTFKMPPEIAQLYLAIMEDIFKTKEGDREKEITCQQKALRELEAKLLKIDEMFVSGDLERDSYHRVKGATKKELQQLEAQIAALRNTDTSFMKYCRYGMSLLTHLDVYYEGALPQVRKKLLGSIFTGKLIFEDGKYRTTGLNEAVALIGLFQKDLQNKKAERLDFSDKTFGNVPSTGAFSNQFIEGMKLLYELEPFIKVKPYLTNQWEKGSRLVKNAS